MKKPNFLKHAWLSFRRSPALTQNILQTLILAFFGFYIAVSFLISGLVAGELIRDFFPGRNVLGMAGAFLIYYFPMDILMRYFLQKFPTLSIKPYLLLPVSKSAMIHYLLRRSLFSFYSFLPLFLTLPFFLVEVLPNASGMEAIGFVVMVLGIIVSSNYISFWISKASDFNNSFSIALLLLLFGFLFLGVQRDHLFLSLFGISSYRIFRQSRLVGHSHPDIRRGLSLPFQLLQKAPDSGEGIEGRNLSAEYQSRVFRSLWSRRSVDGLGAQTTPPL